ncbi:hypothetical protein ACVT98_09270 [Vibrio campbellii]
MDVALSYFFLLKCFLIDNLGVASAMIKIDSELGFSNYVALEYEKDICFVHSNPIEVCLPDFTYAALDVDKYDSWWGANHSESYIPRDLDEILDSPYLIQPSLQYKKSKTKTTRLVENYNSSVKFEFICPVLTEHFPSLQQGRHRFWFARYLELPFVVVAVSAQALKYLIEHDLIYSKSLRSRYVFNRKFEIVQDLTKPLGN